jgi:serine protease
MQAGVQWAAVVMLWGAALAVPALAAEQGPRRALPQPVAQDGTARVIVKLRSDAELLRQQAQTAAARSTGPQLAAALGRRLGLALSDGRGLGPRMQVLRASGLDSATLARRLAADANVEWAVEDQRQFALAAPNDPLYPDGAGGSTPSVGQWYLRAPTGLQVSGINIEAAWAQTTGNASLVVAVLDTGIRAEHPDLAGKTLPGYDFVGYSGVASVATANDGDLDDADPSDPGDWITSAENSSGEFRDCGVDNSSWHGTQVAGLIGAATDNGIGMAGSGRDVKVLPVRVLGKCGGYVSDIVAGMRWAAGLSVAGVAANPHPARVLNLSLGGSGPCSAAYADAVAEVIAAGVTVVAAAGNEGLAVGAPANCSGVIGVAGVRHVGTKVGYSSLGPEVTLSAPAGNCVNLSGACLYPLLTTTNAGTTSPTSSSYSNSANYSVGTSFSSPLVAGTVALMLSANPALTPAQVTTALKATARPFPTTGGDDGTAACQAPGSVAQDDECYCTTSTCGAGLLDAGAAVAAAQGTLAGFSFSASSVLVGDSVTLDASASTVASGRSISSYLWEVASGASLVQFNSATNASTATLATLGAGTASVRLTVTDSAGATSAVVRNLVIGNSVLQAIPVASSTTPEVGDLVSLSGAGSATDGGRSITAWQWQIVSGGTLARFTTGTTAATATLEAQAAGTVVVQLTVTDSTGRQDSSTLTLTLSAPAAADGGGGGGLFGPVWALGLLLAGLALGARRRGH